MTTTFKLKHQTQFFLLIINFLSLFPTSDAFGQAHIPYNFDKPFAYYDLPAILDEISGLGIAANADRLVSIQDEKGQVFFIDKRGAKVTPSVIFKNEGDFESIEMVKDTIFAVNSKGHIYKIWNYEKPVPNVKMYKTGLSKDDNIEGIAYDKKQNRLILAAKGAKDGEFYKKFFACNLTDPELVANPLFEVVYEDFKAFLTQVKGREYGPLVDTYVKSPRASGFEFAPSGIAVHPVTGNFYVISSIGKVLVVLSPKGRVLDMARLPKTLHAQPEGICIDADGTLYISNEAKDNKPAQLYVYKMK